MRRAVLPDGTRIAYVGEYPDDPATPEYDPKEAIYTIPSGGGQPTLVLNGFADSLEWSPDGSKIAYASGNLWTVPAEGGTPTRLTEQNVYGWAGIDWSPDGKTVAFVSYARAWWNDDHSIWTVPAAGGAPTNLTGGGVRFHTYPEWSPDGSKIAYVEEANGVCSSGSALKTVSPSGGASTKVAEIVGYVPDGLDWGTSPWRTAPPDTEPPEVLCTRPAEGSNDVSTSPGVSADFSEELDPATITPATFYLTKEASEERVEATVGCDPRTCRAARLHVAEHLDYDATYALTVEGGADGVRDEAGNALAEDKSWSFTTYDGIRPTASLTAPTEGARVSGTSVTLSAEATDNRGVKDVSFYVVDAQDGSDYVRVGADSTPGGPSGSEYSVSWDSTGVPDSQKAVRAYAADVSRNIGNSADIIVTVDNHVPEIVNVVPDAGTKGARRGADVRASFSEEMQPATARAGTFMLVKAKTGKRVAATVSCPAPCTEAELDPSAPLAANTRYKATVTTGIKDMAGTALDQPKVWSFKTGG